MDSAITKWLNSGVGQSAALDNVMEVLVSDYFIPVTLSLLLLGIFFADNTDRKAPLRYKVGAVTGMIAVGFSNWITIAINGILFRDRPYIEYDLILLFYKPTDSSFPANSAAIAFGIATGLFLANPRLGLIACALSILYGISRVYAGVHYPSDILVGACIGIVSALAGYLLVHRLMRVFQLVIQQLKALRLA